MACYRVVYRNQQSFCVEVDALSAPPGLKPTFVAVVYRVTGDVRASRSVERADGHPMVVYGETAKAVFAAATMAIATMCGTEVDGFIKCCDGPYEAEAAPAETDGVPRHI